MFSPNEIARALQQELGPKFRCRGSKVWYRKPMRGMPYLLVQETCIVGEWVMFPALGVRRTEEVSWPLSDPGSIEQAVTWLRRSYSV